MRVLWIFLALGLTAADASGQAMTAKDCIPILKARDYFSYSRENHYRLDYLKSIDAATWEEIRRSSNSDFGAEYSDVGLSMSDSYAAFDAKRSQYLEKKSYHREQDEALKILQITTNPRAYSAFDSCIRALPVGSGLAVWATTETLDQIELHVRYMNPPSVPSMAMEGMITGGSVAGAPVGRLWPDGTTWGVSQEKVFLIDAAPGVAETRVIVAPTDGSPPASLSFKRSDGMLQLTFSGSVEVLRQERTADVTTPSVNHHDWCPAHVGWEKHACIQLNRIELNTASPRFFKNARHGPCSQEGCSWSTPGPIVYSPDRTHVSSTRNDWGPEFTFTLVADEYETVSAQQCGAPAAIPIIRGQSVVFGVPKDCLAIGALMLTELPGQTKTALKLGDKTTSDGHLVLDSQVDSGSSVLFTYRYMPLQKDAVK
jgi:hypothetical protein